MYSQYLAKEEKLNPLGEDKSVAVKEFTFKVFDQLNTFDPEVQNEVLMFLKQRLKENRECQCKEAEERIMQSKSVIEKLNKLNSELT